MKLVNPTTLLLIFVFIPEIVYSSITSDFTVNRQSVYSVPRDISNVLVLDLTLPEPPESSTLQVKSIKIHNAGTADHLDFSRLKIWEDGPSAGWDNDETQVAEVLVSLFDTEILGTFRAYSQGDAWQRIFVTVDTTSEVISLDERTIQPELVIGSVVFTDTAFNGPTDINVIGFERIISRDASIPTAPVTPLAGTPEALSSSAIRWHFTDLSNNEFGFKIFDSESREIARVKEANISYIDETGLTPNTKHSGRYVVAFNDRGESLTSALSLFESVYTLEEVIEEVEEVEEIEEIEETEEIEEVEEVVEPETEEPEETEPAESQDIQAGEEELVEEAEEVIEEEIVISQEEVEEVKEPKEDAEAIKKPSLFEIIWQKIKDFFSRLANLFKQ